MAPPDRPMHGKTCLITGATSGIGELTALELARQGATTVVVGRSRVRLDASVEMIRSRSGNPDVHGLLADLSSQAEIRRLASEFLRTFPRLDVLVNNAGAMFAERTETVDGIERTFALNHVAYFLLTELLLDRLKADAPARVVNVASEAHRMVRGIDFADVEAKASYRGFRVYGASKLANILFTAELARRLAGTGVTANCLHPGFVATNFTAGNGRLGWIFRRLASVFAISPESGSKTSIYLAGAPEVEGVSGLYFSKKKPVRPTAAARDEDAARRLWDLSVAMTRPASAVTVEFPVHRDRGR